jgi:hypothetical protein
LSHHRFLFLLKHKEEGDGNLLPSPSSLQQHHKKKQWRIVVMFFFNTKKKATIISCHCLFLFNTTREEGDGNKLSLLSSLQHHHGRKRW